jgi:hypothetical protein
MYVFMKEKLLLFFFLQYIHVANYQMKREK